MTRVLRRSARADVAGYIVRAGADHRLGSSDEVLGRFATEGEARQAFLALRLSPAYRHGWAEVVAVGGGQPPMPLCWFGDHAPSGTPASPLYRGRPLTTQSRAVQIDHQGATMQTKEQVPVAAPAADLDRPLRGRRSLVAALVAVLAAATLAIAAASGNGSDESPTDRPVPTWEVVPAPPTDVPYYGSSADG